MTIGTIKCIPEILAQTLSTDSNNLSTSTTHFCVTLLIGLPLPASAGSLPQDQPLYADLPRGQLQARDTDTQVSGVDMSF